MKQFVIKLFFVVACITPLIVLTSCIPPYWDVPHDWFPFASIPVLSFPLGIIGLGVYFLPTIIAALRKHKNILGMVLVNVFAGWTVIGWIVALVWSLTGESSKAD